MTLNLRITPFLRRLCGTAHSGSDSPEPGKEEGPTYQLVKWPELPDALHTAEVMGALSVMTQRPVTAHWFSSRVKWQLDKTTEFLEGLCLSGEARQGAVGDALPQWSSGQ